MRPITTFLLTAFFLFPFFLFAQSILLQGQVVAKGNGAAIPFGNLLVFGSSNGTVSAETGLFDLRVRRLPVRLIVSSLGYQTDTFLITRPTPLLLQLSRTDAALPQINVNALQQWTTLDKKMGLPIDFTICNNQLFLLGKTGLWNQFHLAAYDDQGNKLHDRAYKIGRITDLETNCFDQLILKTPEFAIRIDPASGSLDPIEKILIKEYESVYESCRASTDSLLYLEWQDFEGFRKLYLAGERASGVFDLFKTIWFREQAGKVRRTAPYYEWANNTVHNMGDITYAENQKIRHSQGAIDFEVAIVNKNPTNNYFFLQHDTVVLFNFDEDRIESFSARGDSLASVEIEFNGKNLGGQHTDARMINDPITGKFYTMLFKKGAYRLYEVSLFTGGLLQEYKLDIVRCRKIAILNDHIFLLGVPKRDRKTDFQRFMKRRLVMR